jgi:hypothetical protein
VGTVGVTVDLSVSLLVSSIVVQAGGAGVGDGALLVGLIMVSWRLGEETVLCYV